MGQALVELGVLAESVLELDPLHLGLLQAEDAEADHDVGGVASEVGDLGAEVAQVVQFGHLVLLCPGRRGVAGGLVD